MGNLVEPERTDATEHPANTAVETKMSTGLPAIPPAPPRRKPRWRRAFRALMQLLAQADDTAKAQDQIVAIGDRAFEAKFQKFLTSPMAPALLTERPSLVETLSDRSYLEALSDDSFGRAYQAYMDANGYEAQALISMQRDTEARWEREEDVPELDEYRKWFSDRCLLAHDFNHVLTEYGTDGVGEATLLAFTLAQEPSRAGALLTVGAALKIRSYFGNRWLRYDLRAWRRGRRAVCVWSMPWEELLPMRLATVRALLRIEPTEVAHPEGIIRGGSSPADPLQRAV